MEDMTVFDQAVAAIDSGKVKELFDLIAKRPDIIKYRAPNNQEGYFKDPYLLWFIADNPIRTGKLPADILGITRLLIKTAKSETPGTFQQQIDYTLVLVASGRTPRECGKQTEMIDLLINAGASPDCAMAAITNGNIGAVQQLVNCGGKLNLAIAVCLELMEDIDQLAANASNDEKLTAITAAAFYGKTDMVAYLLALGIDANGFPSKDSGFHGHATPLHQAVSSGSLDCVKLLVSAGAKLNLRDRIYHGTPLEWASHLQSEDFCDAARKRELSQIETFLRSIT